MILYEKINLWRTWDASEIDASTIKWLYKPTTEYNLNLWNLKIWFWMSRIVAAFLLVEFPQHESIHTRDTVDGRNPANHLECIKNIVNNGINYLSGPINWCRIFSINSIFDHLNEMRFFAELQISRSCNSRGLGFFRHLFVASSRAHAKGYPSTPEKRRATQTTHNSKMV